ncbi:unnamed protein product [Phytophthora fragariaefolia]|uniref:Unnamed protein product n=1 Tax=Phytophthora fragariaefolia TaxID=1490495 RepID=A0A9W6XIK6_9STRA|nr:unnamed protein product [Phytophthora fragariaefolia]
MSELSRGEISSVKRPDSCRGAALETDVKPADQPYRDMEQREAPNSVNGRQKNAYTGEGSTVQGGAESLRREGATGDVCRSSSTKGIDTFVETMFTLGVAGETDIQNKYTTREKLRKFLCGEVPSHNLKPSLPDPGVSPDP